MEPKNHPIEKYNHLPNLHDFGFQPLIFQGVLLELGWNKWNLGERSATSLQSSWGFEFLCGDLVKPEIDKYIEVI